MSHPYIAFYEQLHNVHVYGSGVKCTNEGWRCRDKENRNYIWAPTLDQLIVKAPHAVKHLKQPKPVKPPKSLASKPFVRRRPNELTLYETKHNVTIAGFNVQKRQDRWVCMPPSKQGPLRSFESLDALIAECPYVTVSKGYLNGPICI